MNKVILIGNLGKDPEVKNFNDGGKIVAFSVATTNNWKDKDGNKQSRTDWHNVAIKTKGLAGVAEQYLKKGDKVMIEGELQYRSYDDKDGNKKYITEVVAQSMEMLSGKSSNSSNNASNNTTNNTTSNANASTGATGAGSVTEPSFDDDLPF